MRSILSERNIVVVLFVMVLVTFALAHEDSKKMEQSFVGDSTPIPPAKPLVNNEAIPTSLPYIFSAKD